jgi:RimM protein, required for 16S rRNA processing
MMESKTLFPIAKITKAFGFRGKVGLQPLIRQYDDYFFNKQLSIGLNKKSVKNLNIIKTSGSKKKKLLFSGLKSRDDARVNNWKLHICTSFNW